jgi:prevent-host-death family protein
MSITVERDNSDDLGTLVNRVVYGKERVKVIQDGKPVAAVIPIEDLVFLEDLEDRLDILEALEALEEARTEGGVKTWDSFAAELGLSD